MSGTQTMQHRLVETIPRAIEPGVLYVSEEYATAVHKCCCGCGHEVVTPLGPTDWAVEIEGDAVSVFPSIGNWSLSCRSHYWIDRGQVRWAAQWSEEQINYGRARDRIAKQRLYGELDASKPGLWARFWRWLTGR